jgi:hypothetical protein
MKKVEMGKSEEMEALKGAIFVSEEGKRKCATSDNGEEERLGE